ncbi:MAG TPA: TonB-dependent receptor [Flavobacteriales bacterium]
MMNVWLKGRASTILLLLSQPLLAQQHPDTNALRPVEVQATRIAGPLPRTGRHLQVLDSLQLHGAVRSEVAEVLRARTLVDVRQRGPFDAQTDIGLRGGTFDQALVLVDGIPMSDPQTGHHLLDLPLLTDALERVEVLYGGASRTFGAGAFSGAVNLITRAPKDDRGQLTIDGGSFGMRRIRATQDLMLGRTGLRIGGFHAHSDGYVTNSDFDQAGGQLDVRHAFAKSSLRVQAAYAHKRFGAQNFYSSLYPDQQEITGTGLLSAAWEQQGPTWSFQARAYHRRHDDEFQLFREDDDNYRFNNGYFIRGTADTARFGPTAFYTYHNRHRTGVSGGEVSVKRQWSAGVSAIGVHGRNERLLSNVLGVKLAAPESSGGRDPFTRSDERNNIAVHVDHRYQRGKWVIDGGVLLNLNSVFDPEWAPGIDIVHRWSDRHSTYANAGRAFRFPTWTDLYYNRGGAVGSLDLRPEHADQVELGHRITGRTFAFKTAIWRRQGRDLIDWVKLPGETTVHAANLTAVDINGVEAEVTLQQGRGRGGLLYAYQWTDRTAFPFTSLYVLDHLTHNAILWWNQRLVRGFSAQLDLSWRQRYGTYARFSDGTLLDYPDPLRVDLRVEWTHGNWTLFASGYNLLDSEQMDRANVPLPGRCLSGGLRVQWSARNKPNVSSGSTN